jgi:hypothetical protein
MRTVWLLAGVFIALTLGDTYTTWACLHEPVPGWDVIEANPASEWLFAKLGLVPGLAVDSVLTLLVALWVVRTTKVSIIWKLFYCTLGIIVTALAVYNNLQGMIKMELI